ncbi:hypothetical protein [Streptomyces yanii]|uniref:Uncharacterized protein n=1 Tax=Streptomyces yanii TaxID=78510 RepID=A0ABV5R6N0_9ACTN
MSDQTPISLSKDLESPAQLRRRQLLLVAIPCLVSAVIGGVLFAWEPWVDRSPFVARTFALSGSALFNDEGDGTCHPKEGAEKRKLLGEDKQVLATGSASEGIVLSALYGDAASMCLYYTEYRKVPAGEDVYYETQEQKFYTEDGKLSPSSELTESSLRRSFTEVTKEYVHFKEPDN